MEEGRLVGGLWIPEGDEQLLSGFNGEVKAYKRPRIDGEIAWGYHRIQAAFNLLAPERRSVAIDAGAHIGLWTRWLAREFKLTHAFEPILRHYRLLVRNLPPAHRHKVYLHRCALDNMNLAVDMVVERRISGRSHVAVHDEEATVSVPSWTLDSFKIEHLDLLKIDVEGFERRVLLGGEQTIRRDEPLIVIEQLGHEERYCEPRDAALTLLLDWGAVELRDNIKGDFYVGWRD